jgi:hypothetical protein
MSVDRIIYFKAWRRFLVFLMLTLFLVSTGIPVTLSHAQKRFKPEVVLPKDYPDGFDGFGPLEALNENSVVIMDVSIRLVPFVTYHTPTNMNSTAAEFRIGDLVGYLKNETGEITSLWLIE